MRDLIAFVYGLAFFSLGIAAAANRELAAADDRIVKGRPFLVSFGILHGLAEWTALSTFVSKALLMESVALGIHGFSFVLLAFFGMALLGIREDSPAVRTLALGVFLSWCALFYLPGLASGTLSLARPTSRLLLNLPAGLLCFAALINYAGASLKSAPERLAGGVRSLAYSFGTYALLSGFPLELLPSYAAMTPWLELARTICSTLIAFQYTWVQHNLEWEARKKQRSDQRRLDAIEDRRRLADELHDRVIQRLFGLGLELERWERRHPDSEALDLVVESKTGLNAAIADIRNYLFETACLGISVEEFKSIVGNAMEEACADPTIRARMDIAFPSVLESAGCREELEQLARLCEEGIRNARKHSALTGLALVIKEEPPDLVIKLTSSGQPRSGGDTGQEQGAPGSSGGYGLKAIRHRVASLGGYLDWRTGESGSMLVVRLPWRDWNE